MIGRRRLGPPRRGRRRGRSGRRDARAREGCGPRHAASVAVRARRDATDQRRRPLGAAHTAARLAHIARTPSRDRAPPFHGSDRRARHDRAPLPRPGAAARAPRLLHLRGSPGQRRRRRAVASGRARQRGAPGHRPRTSVRPLSRSRERQGERAHQMIPRRRRQGAILLPRLPPRRPDLQRLHGGRTRRGARRRGRARAQRQELAHIQRRQPRARLHRTRRGLRPTQRVRGPRARLTPGAAPGRPRRRLLDPVLLGGGELRGWDDQHELAHAETGAGEGGEQAQPGAPEAAKRPSSVAAEDGREARLVPRLHRLDPPQRRRARRGARGHGPA